MATTMLKPRWALWEIECIKKAFSQKVQHKVIALSLGKTVSSVSKKITKLGLRAPSRTRGRVKGSLQGLQPVDRTPHDVKTMAEILKTYAPLYCIQQGELALERGYWTNEQTSLREDAKKGACFGRLEQANASFSYVEPLDFIPSKNVTSVSQEQKSLPQKESLYVSLASVELWAHSEGFQKTEGALRGNGLRYWKDGCYFSNAQLLIYINRLRSDGNLQPLFFREEEC